MNQNIFCNKCHRIPSQCCCSSAKELTDEEIVNLYKETEADNGGIREFARAILKRASEK
jgi:hypothetical protein